MIERYDLNLGRGFCCNAPTRKKYYFWMILYLLLAGGVLIDGAYQIASRISQVRNAESSYSDLKKAFAENHDGIESPDEYMKTLVSQLKAQGVKIKDLQAQANPGIPFLPVLFEVQNTLPKAVVMSSFEMSTNRLAVTLYFPPTGAKPEPYLQQWRENVALAHYLEPLEVVGRVNGVDVRGNKMIELSCAAALKKR